MFALGRSTRSLVSVRSIQQTVLRQQHKKKKLEFHQQFGLPILLSGAVFVCSSWGYLLCQLELHNYLSPIGRVRPREWKKD
uniref:Cytochrome c oxidase subunit 7B, mitochondrial n=1 Tax=Monodelphis domestica TaxID=13616 RepID=A0A5F8H878_MONDO